MNLFINESKLDLMVFSKMEVRSVMKKAKPRDNNKKAEEAIAYFRKLKPTSSITGVIEPHSQ